MNELSSDTQAYALQGTPGEILRTAREAQGLSLSDVSLHLNLSERVLAQIEQSDFSGVSGHTFARGYVRAYAKLLGLDQVQLVQIFNQHTGTNAKGSEVHSLGRIEEPVRYSSLWLRLVSLVLLALLGGIGFFWWQENGAGFNTSQLALPPAHVEVEGADGAVQIHPLDDTAETATPKVTDSTALPLPLLKAPVASSMAAAVGKEAAPAEASAPEKVSSSGESAKLASPSTPSTPAPISAQPESEAVSETPAELPAGHGQIALRFTANCWVRVIDGDGRVLLNALMKPGSTQSMQAKEPINVRLGYAKGAQVTYNGSPIDLVPHTKGSVARVQLGH